MPIETAELVADRLIEEGLPHLPSEVREFAQFGVERGYIPNTQVLERDWIVSKHFVFWVSIHEVGHAIMVKENGDYLNVLSVKPSGDSLGHTSWSSNPGHSLEKDFGNRIAASHGGEAAEELFGKTYHPGSGSDRGHGRFYARALSNISGEDEGSLFSNHNSRARQTINSYGQEYIKSRAWSLTLNQISLN